MRPRQVLAGAVALVIVACIPAVVALEMASGTKTTRLVEDIVFVVVVLASVVVGWMLAHRRPDNVIGWLLLANGFILVQTGLGDAYVASVLDFEATTARVAAAWSTQDRKSTR